MICLNDVTVIFVAIMLHSSIISLYLSLFCFLTQRAFLLNYILVFISAILLWNTSALFISVIIILLFDAYVHLRVFLWLCSTYFWVIYLLLTQLVISSPLIILSAEWYWERLGIRRVSPVSLLLGSMARTNTSIHYISVSISIRLSVCVSLYLFVCVRACTHIQINIWTHTHRWIWK